MKLLFCRGHGFTACGKLASFEGGTASEPAGKKQGTPSAGSTRFTPQQVAEAHGVRKSTRLDAPPIQKYCPGPFWEKRENKSKAPRAGSTRFTPQQVAKANGIRKSTKLGAPPIQKYCPGPFWEKHSPTPGPSTFSAASLGRGNKQLEKLQPLGSETAGASAIPKSRRHTAPLYSR